MKDKNKTNTTNTKKVKRYKKTNVIFPVIGGVALVGGAAAGIAIGVTHLPVVRAEENTLYVNPNNNEADLTFKVNEEVKENKVSLKMLDTAEKNGEDEAKVVFADGGEALYDQEVIENEVLTRVKLAAAPDIAGTYTYNFGIEMTYTNSKGKDVKRTISNLKLVYVCENFINNDKPTMTTAEAVWHKNLDDTYSSKITFEDFEFIGFDIAPYVKSNFGDETKIKTSAQVTNFDLENKTFDVVVDMLSPIDPQTSLSEGYLTFIDARSGEEVKVSSERGKYGFISAVTPTALTCQVQDAEGNPITYLEKGLSAKAVITSVTPAEASKEVTWAADSDVISIDSETGEITASSTKSGKVTIIATSVADPTIITTADLEVVGVMPTKVSITIDDKDKDHQIEVGETAQANYEIEPKEAEIQEVTWHCSVDGVVTIGSDGKIVGIKNGTTKIYAISVAGAVKSNEIELQVVDKPTITGIKILDKDEKDPGGSLTLSVGDDPATVEGFHAEVATEGEVTDKTYLWSSSDPTVVETKEEKTGVFSIIAKAKGTSVITVVANADKNITDTITVTVNDIQPTGVTVSFDGETKSIRVGETIKANAVVAPKEASQTVTWSTDNAAVAVVDQKGVVTAVKAGTVNVMAKSVVDSEKVGAALLTVNEASPEGLTLSVAKPDILVNETTSTHVTTTSGSTSVTLTASPADALNIDQKTGLITGLKAYKEVTLTATSKVDDTKKSSITMSVTARPEIIVALGKNEITPDETTTATAYITPEGTGTVTWSSSNTNIVKVGTEPGLTTTVTPAEDGDEGTATIIARSTLDDSIIGSAIITVKKPVTPVPTALSVTSDEEAVQVSGTATISYNLEGDEGADWTTTWEVEGGTLTGTDDGKTKNKSGTLTFTANSSEGVAKIKATNDTVSSLTKSIDINVINATKPTDITINGLPVSTDHPERQVFTAGQSAILDGSVQSGDSIDWSFAQPTTAATLEGSVLKISSTATSETSFAIQAKSHTNPSAGTETIIIYVTDFIPAAMTNWSLENGKTVFNVGDSGVKVTGCKIVDTLGDSYPIPAREKNFSVNSTGLTKFDVSSTGEVGSKTWTITPKTGATPGNETLYASWMHAGVTVVGELTLTIAEPVTATSIVPLFDKTTIAVGETINLNNCLVNYSDGTSKNFNTGALQNDNITLAADSSGNASVTQATSSSVASVTGIKAGPATITVTGPNNVSTDIPITVGEVKNPAVVTYPGSTTFTTDWSSSSPWSARINDIEFGISGLAAADKSKVKAQAYINYQGVYINTPTPTITWVDDPETGIPSSLNFDIAFGSTSGNTVTSADLTIIITQEIDGQQVIIYQSNGWKVTINPVTPP